MADITPIKPIKLCVNITIPTIDDDSISLYEAVGVLGNKMQEAIQKINESFGSLEGAYSAENPPPYPVTSVNGQTGEIIIDIPSNVYTEDNPPPYPVTSVNKAETKDVITVFVPEGGGIEDVTQTELIAACKAGARLGAFDQDDGTCRLYHFNLFVNPERVEYKEVAGGGSSGVTSVNDQTGVVNIFNAPINAATAASVAAIEKRVNDYWKTIYPVGAVYISINAQSPSEIFGGMWEQLKDRFLLGAGDDYPAGSIGGEAAHALTRNENGNHNHAIAYSSTGEPITGGNDKFNINEPVVTVLTKSDENGAYYHAWSKPSGLGSPHNNMPPYISVYIWKRVG